MESPYGLHIVRVESRIDERQLSYDEVKDRVRRHVEDLRYRSELKAFLEKARADAEWCVKPRYRHLLPDDTQGTCATS